MTTPLKILMLEDSETDAELVHRLLKKEMSVLEYRLAMDKPGFVQQLDEFQPDVILADNSLPSFNAAEALKITLDRSLYTPFIMVTGAVSEEFAAAIIKSGADDYILKNGINKLPVAITAALKKKRAEKEKLEALEKLSESEERYRTLIERVSDAFIAFDKNMCYTYVNKKAGELIRRDPQSLIGKCVWDEFPAAIGPATHDGFLKAMATQQYISNTDYFEPLQLWQETHLYPSPDGLSVFIRDITHRKEAEEKLNESLEQTRLLASRLQDVREEERAAMAREIHDELGQQLTGLKMDITWLSKKAGPDEKIQQKIKGTLDLLDTMVKTVRKIATELRPSILDDLGLVEAMGWQSNEFEKRSGISVQFRSDEINFSIAGNIAIALFRIYQESLTNVARHSGATRVDTQLRVDNNHLVLTITDNGNGFEILKTGYKKTLGLLGMKERSLTIGGSYDMTSKPGEGTTVLVSVPLGGQGATA